MIYDCSIAYMMAYMTALPHVRLLYRVYDYSIAYTSALSHLRLLYRSPAFAADEMLSGLTAAT